MAEVLAAVYAALHVNGYTTLSTGGVFNDVPQGTAFPFTWIAKGEPPEEPYDTFGKIGAICRVDVHIYSQYAGDSESEAMVEKATQLLHHVALAISGWETLNVVREPTRFDLVEIDGVTTRHTVAPFAIQVLES